MLRLALSQVMDTSFRPSLTDFCGGKPGYSGGDVHNSMYGTFTFNKSNCTLIIDQLEGETDGGFPLPFYAGAGPSVEYKLLSRQLQQQPLKEASYNKDSK